MDAATTGITELIDSGENAQALDLVIKSLVGYAATQDAESLGGLLRSMTEHARREQRPSPDRSHAAYLVCLTITRWTAAPLARERSELRAELERLVVMDLGAEQAKRVLRNV